MKKIDIIATIGPSSISRPVLKRMASEGMTIARINTKYGSVKQYEEIMRNLEGLKCRLLFDVKGPKMLGWVGRQKCDYVAVSFAETAGQVRAVRKLVNCKIISKIETMKGVRNIDSLIEASDGIMIARGDLGRNAGFEKVPMLQKMIIRKCNRHRKMDITATEMMLSMTESRVPERAEVSDVANAVLDGSDALMLSEETAIGKNPVLVIRTMSRIIRETLRVGRKTASGAKKLI